MATGGEVQGSGVSTLKAWLLLTLLVTLTLTVKSTAALSGEKNRVEYVFTNQSLLNATVQLKSCRGEDVTQVSVPAPVLTLKGLNNINYTGEFQCHPNFTCRVEYPLPGNYSAEVRWLNRVIYAGTLNLDTSGSRVVLNTNTVFVSFYLRTMDRKDLRDLPLELEIGSTKLITTSGRPILLPFGSAKYRAQFSPFQDVVLTVDGEITVSCDSRTVEVKLPVLSRITFTLFLLGGTPARGINGSVYLLFKDLKVGEANLLLSQTIELSYAPLGSYTLRIYLFGRFFGEVQVDVSEKNNTYPVTLPIISDAKLKIFDARGNTVQDDALIAQVTDPLGRAFSERLSVGTVSLTYVPLGRYELRIYSERLGRVISQTYFELQGGEGTVYREISLGITRSRIVVEPEGSSTLPPGSKFIVKSFGVLLLSQYLDAPRDAITGDLGYLPLGATVQFEYSYGVYLYSGELSAGGGTLEVRIPIYDVVLRFVDLDQQQISGCEALLTSPYLNAAKTLSGWEVRIEHFPLSDLLVVVKCLNVEVANRIITANELRHGNITITINVKNIQITVKNTLGRPIAGARVSVSVTSRSGGANITSVTGDDGIALLNRVPFPPSGNVTFQVYYRGIVYRGTLTPLERTRDVVIDVIIDTPFMVLTTSQVLALLFILSIVGVALVIVTRKYSRIRVLRKMFESPFEEEESESVITRLKKALKRKKEEEEEEISLFS